MAAEGGGRGVVRAAGGIVTRPGPHGPEVLLVHRPRYDDWSPPKGKADPGERAVVTARREILEETGHHCEIGDEIAVVDYLDDRGRLKVVRWFAATPTQPYDAPGFVPNDEVDEIRWCPVADAVALVTRASDADVIRAAVAALG